MASVRYIHIYIYIFGTVQGRTQKGARAPPLTTLSVVQYTTVSTVQWRTHGDAQVLPHQQPSLLLGRKAELH